MVVSAVIPIPGNVVERLQLDLAIDENQISTHHYYALSSTNQIGVLTSLWAFQPKSVSTFFFSVFDFDGSLKSQIDLPGTASIIWEQDRLLPVGICYLSNECLLIGGETSHPDKFMTGLYVVDLRRDHVVKRLPWFAARIAWTRDDYLLGTIHANMDRPVRSRLDDAVVISSAPMRGRLEMKKDGGELPPMRLIAVFNPNSPKEFPDAYKGLVIAKPRKRPLLSDGLCGNWQTHTIVPMNDGNFLAAIWETAMSNVMGYCFAIFSREGDPLHLIETGIEKYSEFANDPIHGVLVYQGTSEMAIYDYNGKRSATFPLEKTTASSLKGYELNSINQQGRLLFASSVRKQTNCFFVLDGCDDPEYTNFQSVVNEGVKKHKAWLQKRRTDLKPNYHRWTD
jgi:hypothetical protein